MVTGEYFLYSDGLTDVLIFRPSIALEEGVNPELWCIDNAIRILEETKKDINEHPSNGE